jgi:uncharacterized protein YggU (UPF0235/DUF167 family)
LTSPPVDNAANTAVCKFVAELLDIPSGRVELHSGHRSRVKLLTVAGFAGPWPWQDSSAR